MLLLSGVSRRGWKFQRVLKRRGALYGLLVPWLSMALTRQKYSWSLESACFGVNSVLAVT